MLSARELRFHFASKKERPRLVALLESVHKYVPVTAENMHPEFHEGQLSELPWIVVRPETPQLFCNCMHPSCCRDHGYAK